MWRFILERARAQATQMGQGFVGEALTALDASFSAVAPTTRDQVQLVAKQLSGQEVLRLGIRISPPAVAGQTLLAALDELPSKPVSR